jgi:hypothetical protein
VNEKREPITIDVKPEEITVEHPARPLRVVKPRRPRRQRPLLHSARDLDEIGEIVQTPNFWLGLIAELWTKRR